MATRRESSNFYRVLRELMVRKDLRLVDLAAVLGSVGYPITSEVIGKYRTRTPPPEFVAALARAGFAPAEIKALIEARKQDVELEYLSCLVLKESN